MLWRDPSGVALAQPTPLGRFQSRRWLLFPRGVLLRVTARVAIRT